MDAIDKNWIHFYDRYTKYARLFLDEQSARIVADKAAREFDDVHAATLDGEMIGIAHTRMTKARSAHTAICEDTRAEKDRLAEAAFAFMRDFSVLAAESKPHPLTLTFLCNGD
jgi:hypothetical protein